METIEIEGFIKDYYKQIYVNKMDKLEEMGKSLERFNIPGITNEEIDNMNIPNPSTEIESIIKKLSTKKSPGPEDFTGKFYQQTTTECSNYRTIALISQDSKVMLKILQARLQQYVKNTNLSS